MAHIKDIQTEIEALSEEEFVRLREWFSEKDAQRWDAQIENDAATGRLNFLLEEAADAKAQGKLRDL